MVDSMKPGSVVVDLAAATGGNCAYTEAGKVVTTENQVKIIGYTDFQVVYQHNLPNFTVQT